MLQHSHRFVGTLLTIHRFNCYVQLCIGEEVEALWPAQGRPIWHAATVESIQGKKCGDQLAVPVEKL